MSEDSVAFDAVLELCRERHRRIVLAVLCGEDRPLTIRDLSKAVVTHNHHVPLSEVAGAEVATIRQRLHHVHVPKLEAGGVVDYDAERRVVTPTGIDRLEPVLSAVVDADPDLESPVEL